MDDEIKSKFDDFDRRISSVDKRFDDIGKRFDDVKWYITGASTIFTIIFAVVGLIFGMNINSEKTDLRETMNKITNQATKSEEDLKKFETELKALRSRSRRSAPAAYPLHARYPCRTPRRSPSVSRLTGRTMPDRGCGLSAPARQGTGDSGLDRSLRNEKQSDFLLSDIDLHFRKAPQGIAEICGADAEHQFGSRTR
jgi:hypothetical protein